MSSWNFRWFSVPPTLLFGDKLEFKSSYDKTVFWFWTTNECCTTIFFDFSYNIHLVSIFGLILKETIYKNCRIDVLSNLIFKGLYFPNENILRKSKKNGRAVNTLLGIGVFILVEKLTDKKFIGKKHEHVSILRVFFNVKNLGIYSFFSNSHFTIKNLNLSQLWGSTQISITYSIKYTFWRLKKRCLETSVIP